MKRKVTLFLAVGALLAGAAMPVAYAQQGEKAGEYVDDSAITAKVKSSLLKEKKLKSLPISVETSGGVVTLSGTVVSSAQKDAAEDVAKHVRGVKDVHDALQLKNEQ